MPPRLRPLDFQRLSETESLERATAFAARAARRRTVRDFSPDPVPREVIARCLTAAGTAPSGANQQPWHFVAVGRDDADLRRRLRAAAEAEEREFYATRAPAEWLAGARASMSSKEVVAASGAVQSCSSRMPGVSMSKPPPGSGTSWRCRVV